MGGSRSASRPKRQSTKSSVSYVESDDDEEFLPSSRAGASSAADNRRSNLRGTSHVEDLGIAKGRRTIIVKHPTRPQDPPKEFIPKEVPKKVQKESPVAEKVEASRRKYVEVSGSEDEDENENPILQKEYSAFKYLLEAASDARDEEQEEAAPLSVHRPCSEEIKPESPERVQEQELSHAGIMSRPSEQTFAGVYEVKEAEPSMVYKRKSPSATHEDNALSILSPGKRIKETVRFEKEERNEQDDVSGVDEEEEAAEDGDGDDSWSESSEASDYENKSSIKTDSNVINVSIKKQDKVPKHPKIQVKNSKKAKGSAMSVPLPAAPAKNAQPLLPKKRPGVWAGTQTCSSPGGTPLNVQSSNVAHRRVVGLSRRHRPPPLHPYLVGS